MTGGVKNPSPVVSGHILLTNGLYGWSAPKWRGIDAMRPYQLYTFTAADAPRPGREFTGYTDVDALFAAGVIVGREHAEVWQGARCVGTLNAPSRFSRSSRWAWVAPVN